MKALFTQWSFPTGFALKYAYLGLFLVFIYVWYNPASLYHHWKVFCEN